MSPKAKGLKKVEKLHNQQSFSEVFAAGKRLHFPQGLFLVKKNQVARPRAGVIISKKNIKKAVQRNYLKRLFREWFRLHKQALPEVDLVFVVKKGFIFSEMVKSGDKLIQYAQNNNQFNPRV